MSVIGEGVTATLSMVGGVDCPVTVTVAVPLLVGSTVEVAFKVKVTAVSFKPTVNSPLESMLLFEPPVIVHVTVLAGLLVPLTNTSNCWVAPLATVAVDGLTVTVVTVC